MTLQTIQTIYFSPTGGTKRTALLLADALKEALSVPAEHLDITDLPQTDGAPQPVSTDTLCLFAVPVFGGRVPEAALSRIRRFQGQHTPCILMAVYGNRDFEDALLELFDTVSDCGFLPIAAVSAIAEHSLMRRFAKGRPDAEDKTKLSAFGKAIAYTVQSALRLPNGSVPPSMAHTFEPANAAEGLSENSLNAIALKEEQLPGKRPYKEYKGVPMHPDAGKSCISCGICALHCPVSAIPKETPSKTDAERCISCMRCVSLCPEHARKINPVMLLAAEQKMKKLFEQRREAELIL